MMDQKPVIRRWPLVLLIAAVIAVVTPITGVIGFFASILYTIRFAPGEVDAATRALHVLVFRTGLAAGLGLGLLASVFWCIIMVPFAVKCGKKPDCDEAEPTRTGARIGAVVGAAATILLHWTLASVAGQEIWFWGLVLLAVVFGIPAGLILGAWFGRASRWAARVALGLKPQVIREP